MPAGRDYSSNMKSLAAAAVLLLIAWVVLRVALAITSGLLNLLWIAAIIMGVIWLWNKATGKSRG
jgi:hypothetical protein